MPRARVVKHLILRVQKDPLKSSVLSFQKEGMRYASGESRLCIVRANQFRSKHKQTLKPQILRKFWSISQGFIDLERKAPEGSFKRQCAKAPCSEAQSHFVNRRPGSACLRHFLPAVTILHHCLLRNILSIQTWNGSSKILCLDNLLLNLLEHLMVASK